MRKLLSGFWLLCVLTLPALAQDRTVIGKVTSSDDGTPLPGVTVQVKGTTRGTSTDSEGNYRINAADNARLVFSFIGFNAQEVAIGGRSTVNVTLQSNTTELSEVVVTGYGGTLSKREITGSISKIKGSDIENMPIQSFDRALQGRAAGVQISSANGIPGGAVQVRIRGVGSIAAGTDPLYIVDGVQLNSNRTSSFTSTNPLSFLNPNDIESIEVLKDAAAASIYGSQAANGVVLVTTKKGKAGRTQFNLNTYYAFVEPVKYLDVLNTQQWLQMRTEAVFNQTAATNPAYTVEQARRAVLSSVRLSPELSESEIAALPTYDWQKVGIRSGRGQNYEFSMNGGSDKTTFFISAAYNDQDASLRNVDFKRGTSTINLTHKINNRITLDQKLNLSTITQRGQFGSPNGGTFLGAAAFAGPLIIPVNPIYNPDGSYYGTPATGGLAGILNQNPLMVTELNDIRASTNSAVGNLSLTYRITDNLTLKPFVGMDYRMTRGRYYSDPRTADGINVRGRVQNQFDEITNFISNITLNYNKTFNSVHNVGFLAGAEYRSDVREGISIQAENLPTPDFRYANSAANPIATGGFWTGFRKDALFANLKYEFGGRYVLNLIGRYDGSSRFGRENRYGFFPAAAASWLISEESFLKGSPVVNTLKLRASYGSTGNDQIGNFPSLGLFEGGFGYNNQAGMAPTQLSNPNLKWEQNITTNLGLDFGFFNNRITGAVDVFERRSKDLLLFKPVPFVNGFSEVAQNVGEVKNRGIEFEITTTNFDRGGFKWSTSFNYTFVKSNVTKLFDGITPLATPDSLVALPGNTSVIIGYPLGTIFTSRYAGVNPATGRGMWYDANGNITYAPRNPADFKVMGSNIPTTFGGLTNSFSYAGFDLNVLFQYEFGRKEFNSQGSFMSENGGRLFNTLSEVYNRRWQKPGDITDIPRPYNGNAEIRGSSNLTGTRTLEDASYIRLKQIDFGYNIPAAFAKRVRVNRARLYAQAVNLITWSKWTGYDAEFLNLGAGNSGVVPIARTYTVGLQLGF
ncbi:SusC/RagA family TonB-linked outer membrane protein [Nibrella saemangeumensis]|uniref:SusC/RagA family TonB-linked outer membrane protein n=1 Tax=Nibrella saemangeumensis TaxID=1084526 RepID=A0ABP8MK50_9BACT